MKGRKGRRGGQASLQVRKYGPHQDPRVEQVLQHILALQAIAARQQRGLDDTYAEVQELRRAARRAQLGTERSPAGLADELQERIPGMEYAAAATHEDIRKLMDGLSDTDLAYL